jgi:hypothetical protein
MWQDVAGRQRNQSGCEGLHLRLFAPLQPNQPLDSAQREQVQCA